MKKNSDTAKRPVVVHSIMDVLKMLLPMAVSGLLVWWLFRKVDFAQIRHIMSQGVDYRYIFAMMIITTLSHIIRGVRWGIQLRAAGVPRMTATAESVSIFGAYALNLVFPFLGEAWRCVFVSRRMSCKLSTIVGTDIGDRASDGVMIGLLIVLTLFVAHGAIERFAERYPVGEALTRYVTDGTLWIVVAIVIVALVISYILLRHKPFIAKINASARRIWQGFAVLFHMKGIGLYLVLTIGIWVCYYLEAYVCFYAFPFTRELLAHNWGLVPGLVVFVFGSCSMIIPSNGGLGAWNVAVMFALSLYGINQADGAVYSIVCWSFQSIMLIICGIFSAFYIWATDRKKSH